MATVALWSTYSCISLILMKWSPWTSGCTDSSGSFLTFIFISHSPWQPARTFNQTSGGGIRFHLAGAVTKINDRIFVVLARRQHFQDDSLSCLLSCFLFAPGRRTSDPAALFTSPWGRERAKQWANGLRGFLAFPCWSRWPGPVLGSWERGKRSLGGGGSGADSAADAPLISITSCSHKPNCLTFQRGNM